MRAFFSGFLLSLSLCLDIGLVNVAVLRVASQRGTMPAFAVGLGSSVGDLVYALLAVAGMTALLGLPPVRWALWLSGTVVLAYLATKMVREAFHPKVIDIERGPTGPAPVTSLAHHFGWGTSLALASPSAILWFAAVGGSVIASHGGRREVLAPFLAGFFTAGVFWSGTLAYGVGGLRKVLGHRLMQTLAVLSAALFVYFAAKVFCEGYRALIIS